MAEFFGLVIFLFIGGSSDCQAVLSSSTKVASSPKGTFLSLNFGWAVGLALAVWITAGISGAHLNPAMTLALATWRGFSWKKVPFYIFAQVLGGAVGTGLAYGNYIHAIDLYEGGRDIRTPATASLFAPFPLEYMTAASSFFDEFLGALVIGFVVMAALDKRNAAPPLSQLPLVIFILVLGLGVALGMQTSYSFNPARDFGPRLFLTMVGYGQILYTYHGWYWLWGGILAPILGAQVGVGLYDVFLRRVPQENQDNHDEAQDEAQDEVQRDDRDIEKV